MRTRTNLRGSQLADLRASFVLSQAELAAALGVASVTISKAEQLDRIGSLNERLVHILLDDREVSLELGLMPVAIAKACKKGLPVWKPAIGSFYWAPAVRKWAAVTRTRFPASVDSQARDLCKVLGVPLEDGLLWCDVCLEDDIGPNVAFRECRWCHRAVCGASRCADYVLLPSQDTRESLPVACVRCVAAAIQDAAVFLGLHGLALPGIASLADELERQYNARRTAVKDRAADGLDMLARVNETIAYFEAIQRGLTAELEHATRPPDGLPDVFANARLGLAQTDAELPKLRRLQGRIERDHGKLDHEG